MPKLSSSEAAYLLGVSTDTLRRWEKEGKLTSSRTEGGHRRYKKKGLNKLLSILTEGKATRLVLTTKDRLLRFGSELVFSICELYGVEVVILNKAPDSSP